MIQSTIETFIITPIDIIYIILTLSAVFLGIAALAKRERDRIILFCMILTGIACSGIGLSTWRITQLSWNRFAKIPMDPVNTINQYTHAFYPVTWIMFGCAMGYFLCGVSYHLSTHHKTHKKSKAEQTAT
jgi:hypothetical protein